MQIAAPTLPLVSPAATPQTGPEARGKNTQAPARELLKSSPAAVPAATEIDSSEAQEGAGASVSVSAEARGKDQTAIPAAIYAEIWRGGMKVAQVDVHGHVTSLSGLVASGGGGSLAGPLLAAQRAVQVAQQVGGEIRSAGQSLDGQTLMMRARLAKAYAN